MASDRGARDVVAHPAHHTDVELVERLRRGDRAALGLLYDRHAPVLLATANRMLDALKEAEDLVHDVFLEAWERAADYDAQRGSVRTWLLVRLRSRALDRLGRHEHARRDSLEENGDEDGDPVGERVDHAVPLVDRLAIRRVLDQMDADVRQALELVYFAGLTAQDVAAVQAVPLGTVKSRIARGLRLLSALLDPERSP